MSPSSSTSPLVLYRNTDAVLRRRLCRWPFFSAASSNLALALGCAAVSAAARQTIEAVIYHGQRGAVTMADCTLPTTGSNVTNAVLIAYVVLGAGITPWHDSS
jgi:hypothetical protein